jgi:hypothetical protein
MKYKLTISGESIEVPYMEFGIDSNDASEGWADLYVKIEDWEQHVYTDPAKKSFWVNWLDSYCMKKDNPQDRIKSVIAEVYGGTNNDELFRKVSIENAYISAFREGNLLGDDREQMDLMVEIRQAPHLHGDVSVT